MNNAEVIQVCSLYPDTPRFKNRTSGRVYDINGISPCINTCGGGHREPKIVVYEQQETYEDDKGGENPQ